MQVARHHRTIITDVAPSVDGGQWPARRAAGETVSVMAGVIADGHNKLAVLIEVRPPAGEPTTQRLKLRWNDEYVGSFACPTPGRYRFRISAWVDEFATWQDEFRRRVEHHADAQEVTVELLTGAALVREAARRIAHPQALERFAEAMERCEASAALDEELSQLMRRHDRKRGATTSRWYVLEVDPPLAGFAAWYEFFPRSASAVPGRHGTLDDAADRLDRIRAMGFDVVYLPPVHPIGTTFRKGKDNSPAAAPGEPGSPWAIGSREGGHTAVHPELGGLAAFDRFVGRAKSLGLHVALDIAFQCSPDHPYVRKHPEWFQRRADGTIRYAENPPKKYQDVYPLDFTSEEAPSLWIELKRAFEFWIERGVRIFRVDNPHTKAFTFWEWCLGELRAKDPDLIFLAEAFTQPRTMYTLAKLGFNNSYTYFTWRNTKEELTSYMTELAHSDVAEYFRPNFWPNTPDILHEFLVQGGRPAHVIRFILAATLSATYGVYGPPFEHVDCRQHPEREEYANNEKYEVRHWNWHDEESLQPLFQRINQLRRAHPALQQLRSIRFFDVRNKHILGYCKVSGDSRIVCFVNLDPFHEQAADVVLPLDYLGLSGHEPFTVEDLLGGGSFTWQGVWQHIRLNPHVMPAAIYRV